MWGLRFSIVIEIYHNHSSGPLIARIVAPFHGGNRGDKMMI